MDDLSQVKDAKVEISIEAERAALEGQKLDREINRYHDWGDASNEEIEQALRKVEDWKSRLSKIEDRIYTMKKSVLLYDLSSNELDKSTNMMKSLKEDMEMAISVIEKEDEVRGIYSLRSFPSSLFSPHGLSLPLVSILDQIYYQPSFFTSNTYLRIYPWCSVDPNPCLPKRY